MTRKRDGRPQAVRRFIVASCSNEYYDGPSRRSIRAGSTRLFGNTRRADMTRQALTAVAVLFGTAFGARCVVQAQSFRVEKFDIKGDGGTDYVAVEPATGRVFVSRATHMMVVDGPTGNVLGDIPNTPGV